MHPEVKGATLRRAIRAGNRDQRRQAFGFLDGALDVLDAAIPDGDAGLLQRPLWQTALGRGLRVKCSGRRKIRAHDVPAEDRQYCKTR